MMLCTALASLHIIIKTPQGSVWVLWGQEAQYEYSSLQVFGTLQTNGNTFGVADVVVTGHNQHRTGESFCAIGPDWDGDGDAELWVFNPELLKMLIPVSI